MIVSIQLPSRGQGLPHSIAFRRTVAAEVGIQRGPGDGNTPVHLEVVNCSRPNGVATIVAENELQDSGTIFLRGDLQTEPGHAGQIRIRATFGAATFDSDGFSVCAHPCGVQNGPDFCPHVYLKEEDQPFIPNAPATRTLKAGLIVEILVKSDSGCDDDLDEVLDQELVSAAIDQSVSMHGQPQSVPMQGASEPATRARIDRHDSQLLDIIHFAQLLADSVGHWSNDQLDRFQCRRCNMLQWAVIPASGFRVTRSIARGKNNRIRFRITKQPTSCTIQGLTSGPGFSALIDVVLDLDREHVGLQQGLQEALALAGVPPQAEE